MCLIQSFNETSERSRPFLEGNYFTVWLEDQSSLAHTDQCHTGLNSLQFVCVRACVRACVNCFSRTVLYVCLEYCI